jgi:glycosyltransferase involved in cell wall biosynthesis
MEPALISVIVPAFNEETYLAGCLESLLNLDFPVVEREIIVVDNNSTDSTAQIAQSYPVRYVLETRRGAAAARNRGGRVAQGKILAFVDADCRVYEDWLAGIRHVLANQDVDAVIGLCEGVDANIGAEFRQRQRALNIAKIETEADNVRKAATGSFAIRKEVFTENGGFDESFLRSHDTEFSIRLHKRGHKIVFAPQVRVRHNNPTSLREIVEARVKHGFFAYRIAQNCDDEQRKEYFPELSRWYYRYLFVEHGVVEKIVLGLSTFLLRVSVGASVILLQTLNSFGLRGSLYPLFAFVMDLCFLQGKLLCRLSECHGWHIF